MTLREQDKHSIHLKTLSKRRCVSSSFKVTVSDLSGGASVWWFALTWVQFPGGEGFSVWSLHDLPLSALVSFTVEDINIQSLPPTTGTNEDLDLTPGCSPLLLRRGRVECGEQISLYM